MTNSTHDLLCQRQYLLGKVVQLKMGGEDSRLGIWRVISLLDGNQLDEVGSFFDFGVLRAAIHQHVHDLVVPVSAWRWTERKCVIIIMIIVHGRWKWRVGSKATTNEP